jgi:hypothetical protein
MGAQFSLLLNFFVLFLVDWSSIGVHRYLGEWLGMQMPPPMDLSVFAFLKFKVSARKEKELSINNDAAQAAEPHPAPLGKTCGRSQTEQLTRRIGRPSSRLYTFPLQNTLPIHKSHEQETE